MAIFMDLFNIYIMGIIQMLTGFYILAKFLNKKADIIYLFIIVAAGTIILDIVQDSNIAGFLAYALLLLIEGVFICHAAIEFVILYTAIIIGIMQLSYGIVNSLLVILHPLFSQFNQKIVGISFMLLGNMALLLAVFCYYIVYKYFLYRGIIKKQYILMVLTPILMIFLMGEYIISVIYGRTVITYGNEVVINAHSCQIFVVQLLGMASLFCIMFSYKKLLENFRLNTELSLLEQEEHFLVQYVEEIKARYEKTKSFRHDIKNHITIVKELLQKEKTVQALNYIMDIKDMAEEMSFPCNTNNPIADILAGNKLSIAKSMGIDTSCSLVLPYPCNIRDIDFCIILSNALDNAINACKNLDNSAERYIRVAGYKQGDFILIEIENSFHGKNMPDEGTGLANIRTAARKYNGAVGIKTENNTFTLSILLVIPQHI